MKHLRTDMTAPDPDALYTALVDAHRDLDEAASAKLNTKLVLLLANHVGDLGVIREAIEAARAA